MLHVITPIANRILKPKGHSRLARTWMLPLGAVVLIVGHVIFFDRLRHAGASLAVVSGLALLVIAKHLGVLGSLYSVFRRRFRH
jgi:uncharacterized membrane protein YecN with MAPEG domain